MKRFFSLLILFVATTAEAQSDPQNTAVAHTSFVVATPTVDTSAYASGELVGTKLIFSYVTRPQAPTGYIIGACIADKAAQAVDLELVLFSENPTGTTFTDQSAFDPADADLPKILPPISFGSGSRYAFSDNSVHCVDTKAIPILTVDPYDENTRIVYGALVSRGTPTFATSGDITITLMVSQD